ncbi:TetR/AcrR family transcriptional regulator [Streptomyces sp. WMMC1477]|uniref:TetR/AcrR family transcriptional regulator n=1 Tax=Streptomyces sp. WMMC1477 TaxID=3015155 RepID=UPI0022B72F6C|nr:TetR/AcrR family transcriptional regulator [Streptomyces sp. WMMC1477]MCZ7431710.1 TetR/AcrR family transcriptional regulator [Streptomyces sp. WMMC1477]
MRADALRNRERIVDAARELFAELGAEVPLDEVARRAGVGNATLYRNFPDRGALVLGVVQRVTDRIAERAERALGDAGDPFEALCGFVSGAVEERIGALCPLITQTVDHEHPEWVASRDRLQVFVDAVLVRAQEAGAVRTDVAVGDLLMALSQLSRPLPGTGCGRFEPFMARHIQLFLDGLRAPAGSELPGSPVTLEALRQPE